MEFVSVVTLLSIVPGFVAAYTQGDSDYLPMRLWVVAIFVAVPLSGMWALRIFWPYGPAWIIWAESAALIAGFVRAAWVKRREAKLLLDLERARNLGAGGQVGQALELVEIAIRLFDRSLGPYNWRTVRARVTKADILSEAGQRQSAITAYRESLEHQDWNVGRGNPVTMATRQKLITLLLQIDQKSAALAQLMKQAAAYEYLEEKDQPGAVQVRESIAELERELAPPSGHENWEARCDHARALFEQGRIEDGHSALWRLQEEREAAVGADDPSVLSIRFRLANEFAMSWARESELSIWHDVCRTMAIEHFEKLLPDQQRVLGDDHMETGLSKGFLRQLV